MSLEAATLDLEIRKTERRELELERSGVERSEAEAVRDLAVSRRRAEELRVDLAARVGALYRMGRLGYLRTLAAVESGRTFLRGLQVLEYQARRDSEFLSRYEASLTDLATKERQLDERRTELSRVLVEERRREKELEQSRAARAVAFARVSRAAEEERQAVDRTEEKATRLASLLDLLEARGRALPPGAGSIRRFRGALDWPARGPVSVPFGRIPNPRFPRTFLKSSGWTISVPPGTEARAVFAGNVAYAQWLKGYGNLVVVDHGDGVFTLYGRLTPGTVRRGHRLGVGDRVGEVAQPPADEAAGLYFEVRDARASVDPRAWLR